MSYWYLVIGVEPGNLRSSACTTRRWQSEQPHLVAEKFFEDFEDHRRCLVTLIDSRFAGRVKTHVYDRVTTGGVERIEVRR